MIHMYTYIYIYTCIYIYIYIYIEIYIERERNSGWPPTAWPGEPDSNNYLNNTNIGGEIVVEK